MQGKEMGGKEKFGMVIGMDAMTSHSQYGRMLEEADVAGESLGYWPRAQSIEEQLLRSGRMS